MAPQGVPCGQPQWRPWAQQLPRVSSSLGGNLNTPGSGLDPARGTWRDVNGDCLETVCWEETGQECEQREWDRGEHTITYECRRGKLVATETGQSEGEADELQRMKDQFCPRFKEERTVCCALG